jgi:NADPH:quinone reductase-like Zn-dependent oxidoreductase
MARRGDYKAMTGEPPFVPGLECGGVIERVGEGVDAARVGARVSVSPAAPRSNETGGGTYRSHYVCPAGHALAVPDAVGDDQLGALWLSYLTAWGAIVDRYGIGPGDTVGLPAASSSVGLAAAQVARAQGAKVIGLTRHAEKIERIEALETAAFDHLVATHEGNAIKPFHRDLKERTDGAGVDLFFDPVAAGAYLESEIKALATGGTICVYGLLGEPGKVDVHPLILKGGSIEGFVLYELTAGPSTAWRAGCEAILEGFANGVYRQHVDGVFALEDVREAHTAMEQAEHVGKLVMVP